MVLASSARAQNTLELYPREVDLKADLQAFEAVPAVSLPTGVCVKGC